MFHVKRARVNRFIGVFDGSIAIFVQVTLNILPDLVCGLIDAKVSLAENVGIQLQERSH